ncbi:peptide chain release factor aRF-1 [Candidatus Woesearchaeota archaeon]|nr:peptide chain release factor aRF-1 [Candidatus Woesearchaeota archaeon]
MNTKQKIFLRRFIRDLEQIKGRHTELVSVYIPAGYDLNKIIAHLQQEQGTASNIKDKTTRTNVIDSLEKMIRHLRLFKKTPVNGLAVFAGNKAEREGQQDIEVWSIEPPEPVNTRIYRCDQTFVLDLLKNMVEIKDVFGLIVIDNREGNIGVLKGTSVLEIAKFESMVPGKIKAGGQSQQRFARLREEAAHDFYKKVAEAINKEFLGLKELRGILIGGPGPTKETFLDGPYLNNELKKKVIGVKDLSYTGQYGLKELVDKSKEVLAKEEITREKEVMDRFFEALSKDPQKVTYGKDEVIKVLEYGAVDLLIISESADEKLIDQLTELAEKTGTAIEFISTDTSEGNQLKDLGGVAALLRYALE